MIRDKTELAEDFNYPMPFYAQRNIPVIMASNDQYIPYLSVALESMLQYASGEYCYDIWILNTNISVRMKALLEIALKRFSNVHIRYLDVSAFVCDLDLRGRKHISIESYYRLVIPTLFRNYDKVVYLDSDVIVQHDISKLYEVVLGDNLLAAVRDTGVCWGYNAMPYIKSYINDMLELKKPDDYFNAGVLLVNVGGMRARFSDFALIEMAQGGKYIYLDQDVLNVSGQGEIFFLDSRWNVLHDCDGISISTLLANLPRHMAESYLAARKDPWIIHYAGENKPWINPTCEFSECFFEQARSSVFYEIIVQKLALGVAPSSFARRVANKLLPKGSVRREILKQIIGSESRWLGFWRRIYSKFTV